MTSRVTNKLKKKSPDSDVMLARMKERVSFVTFSCDAESSHLYGVAGGLASESGTLAGRVRPHTKGKKKKTHEAQK
jgi:hypothetical protein